MKKFQCLYEGTAKQGNPTFLNEIYTELYITESKSGEINKQHEVRQIETQSRSAATEDAPIKCNDIFRPLPGQDKPIRTVLTKGVAGIGKTVSVQKFIVDWSEGKENQDIQLIFPLPFRELNLMKDEKLSLSDLLQVLFPETKEIEISSDAYKVFFIFDGLDECRLSLDFKSNVKLYDLSESATVDVLLTNLIAGNLLPSSLIWITSRPAAADLVPSECVHRVTEVRGFNDPKKEEYFRKRISDQSLANRIISHLKSSRSLHIMCHIPVFCWISATVLEGMLGKSLKGEIPKTVTQMYTYFLILQTNIKHEKDYEKKLKDEDMILKLGKLAFQQLVKGNLIFYDEDLSECGIDVTEASVYSGLCTQIFKEEFGLYQGKWSALVFVLLTSEQKMEMFDLKKFMGAQNTADEVLQKLLPVIIESRSAQLSDCGITDEGCAALASALRSNPSHLSYLNLSGNKLKDLGINLISSVLDDPHCKMKTLRLIDCGVTDKGCAVLASALRSNPSHLRELNLSGNKLGPSGVKLLSNGLDDPHRNLEILGLKDCNVTDKGCAVLASALISNPSHLQKLDLTRNFLGRSDVKLLSSLKDDPDYELKTLLRSDHKGFSKMSAPDPFQEIMDALKRILTPAIVSSLATPVTTTTSSTILTMARPAPFFGSAEECNGFLLQCSLALEMQLQLYDTEGAKIAIIISLLTGRAMGRDHLVPSW
ncbi:hypothetical protein cypCar_00013932 [Cyprinus carpio]|nr:hypothetical protein cypCar_00013932 [Cyprinus carpio]